MPFKNTALITLLMLGLMQTVHADTYQIDTKKAHAFIQFKIQHLGYSWLYGRFNTFEGAFDLNAQSPEKSHVQVTVDVSSLDSNHAERDKHLRGSKFLNADKYPKAHFKSTTITLLDDKTAVINGELTLHGVTKNIAIQAAHVGGGDDPWGGYRQGFTGSTTLKLKDFGIDYDLGPASTEVELLLDIEGIRQ